MSGGLGWRDVNIIELLFKKGTPAMRREGDEQPRERHSSS